MSWLRRLPCCHIQPSLCLAVSAKDAARVLGLGKERKRGEGACILPVPGSYPPALPLTKGGFASFSPLLYFGQQNWLWYLQTGTLVSAKIFVGFRAKLSFKAGFKERLGDNAMGIYLWKLAERKIWQEE